MTESREPGSAREQSEPKWYQTSIREMLLVTTLVAVVVSMLQTFGVAGWWSMLCAIAALLSPFVAYLLFRAACRRHGIWEPQDWTTGDRCQAGRRNEHDGSDQPQGSPDSAESGE
jgi:hypothetical protein